MFRPDITFAVGWVLGATGQLQTRTNNSKLMLFRETKTRLLKPCSLSDCTGELFHVISRLFIVIDTYARQQSKLHVITCVIERTE